MVSLSRRAERCERGRGSLTSISQRWHDPGRAFDACYWRFFACFEAYFSMSDKPTLLDIEKMFKVGRFVHSMVGKSAVTR